uniref:RING-type domain-containing protein n=1 Tax=Pelusios castaneus TaxID=367368 RepID=A0A8C8RYW8_9SAUR
KSFSAQGISEKEKVKLNSMETKTDELTCPICLEYFTDPVSLACDHNFCRVCITQYWQGSQTVSCTWCRHTFPQRGLKPNRQLRNIVESARGLRLQSGREAETEGLCEKHRELLKPFWKEDEIPICLVCDRSKEHRDHRVIPAEEVAEEFKVGPSVIFTARAWGNSPSPRVRIFFRPRQAWAEPLLGISGLNRFLSNSSKDSCRRSSKGGAVLV